MALNPITPITWKNISAPSSASALSTIRSGSDAIIAAAGRFGNVADGAQTALDGYVDDRTDQALLSINAERDPARRQAMIEAEGAFIDAGRIGEAQRANVTEDRAFQQDANQQTIFGNQQADRVLSLADDETLRQTNIAKENRDQLDQQIKIESHNREQLEAWTELEQYNLDNGLLPSTPKPVPLTMGNVTAALDTSAPTEVQEAAAAFAPTSEDSSVAALPKLTAKQQEYVDKGWITVEQIKENPGINAVDVLATKQQTALDIAAAKIAPTGRPTSINNSSEPISATNDNNTALYSALELHESGGDQTQVSSTGNSGVMQIGETTAAKPGMGVTPMNAPLGQETEEENRRFGRDYMAALMRRYDNDIPTALAAYNWGLGNADKWLSDTQGDLSKLPKETRDHISRISKSMGLPDPITTLTTADSIKQIQDDLSPYTREDFVTPKKYVNANNTQKALDKHTEAVAYNVDKAFETAGLTKGMTTLEAQRAFSKVHGNINTHIPSPDAKDAIDKAARRLGYAPNVLRDPNAAGNIRRSDLVSALETDAKGELNNRAILNNPAWTPDAVSKELGVTIKEAGEILAPYQSQVIEQQFIDTMLEVDENGQSKYAVINEATNAVTLLPHARVAYDNLLKQMRRDNPHIPAATWNNISDNLKTRMDLASATDKAKIATKIKYESSSALATHYSAQIALRKSNNTKYDLAATQKSFPDIGGDEVKEAWDEAEDSPYWQGLPAEIKHQTWLIGEALSRYGKTDADAGGAFGYDLEVRGDPAAVYFGSTFLDQERGSRGLSSSARETRQEAIVFRIKQVIDEYTNPRNIGYKVLTNGEHVPLLGNAVTLPENPAAAAAAAAQVKLDEKRAAAAALTEGT